MAAPNNRGQIGIQVIACILFLFLPYLVRPGKFGEPGFMQDPRDISDLFTYLLLIVFFYFNFYRLVPKYFFNQDYLIYFAIVALCFVLITYVPDSFIPFKHMDMPADMPMYKPKPKGNFFVDKAGRHLFIFIAVLLLSLLLRILARWRVTEKEKLKTELSFLKAQINPHFLFNSLNSIYALSIEKSDDTAEAVVKLSNMMRYVLSETTEELVPLDHDLTYIEDYIALQRLRFGADITIDFRVDGHATDKRIAPMILMPFIENAFKYGVNAAEDSQISIHISINEKSLTMKVTNKLVFVKSTENSSGVGIANTRKRLDLIYAGKYELSTIKKDDHFNVSLQLELQ